MTQEDKELLFRDLCARLPYGVKIDNMGKPSILTSVNNKYRIIVKTAKLDKNSSFSLRDLDVLEIEDAKPYLIPLSKMTEEQRLELEIITDGTIGLDTDSIWDFTGYSEISLSKTLEIIQWCYKNHLDINGLIPMGLAIDATGLNLYN